MFKKFNKKNNSKKDNQNLEKINYEIKSRIQQLPEFKSPEFTNKWYKSPIQYFKEAKQKRHDRSSVLASIESFMQSKKQENLSQRRRFAPSNVIITPKEIEINGRYYRNFRLGDLPLDSSYHRLQSLVNLNIPFVLSLNVKKITKSNLLKTIASQMSQIESEKMQEGTRGKMRNSELDPLYDETRKYYEELQQTWQEGFSYSMSVRLDANKKDDLDIFSNHFVSESLNKGFTFYNEVNNQLKSLQYTLPIAEYDKTHQFDVSTDRLTGILPIFNRLYNDSEGIAMGISHSNSSLLLVDIFKSDNFNGAILGKTRKGKSYCAKNMVWQQSLRGIKQIIIDPQGEWVDMAKKLGGDVQTLLGANAKKVNPFYNYKLEEKNLELDIIYDIEADHILHLGGLFEILWGENYISNESKFRNTISKYFKFIGYKNHLERNTKSFLEFCFNTNDKQVKEDVLLIKSQLQELEEEAPLGRLLSGKNEPDKMLDWRNKLVVIDLSNIASDKSLLVNLYILLFQLKQVAFDPTYKKIIWVDEAHLLFKHKVSGQFLKEMSKTALKKNTGTWVITQELEDFNEANGGKTLLNQAEYIISFTMPSSLEKLIEKTSLLDLTENEVKNLTGLADYNFCLMTHDEHINARSLHVPLMDNVFCTDPDKKKRK
jgi:conjugal transfer ATP-binding protein TraC